MTLQQGRAGDLIREAVAELRRLNQVADAIEAELAASGEVELHGRAGIVALQRLMDLAQGLMTQTPGGLRRQEGFDAGGFYRQLHTLAASISHSIAAEQEREEARQGAAAARQDLADRFSGLESKIADLKAKVAAGQSELLAELGAAEKERARLVAAHGS